MQTMPHIIVPTIDGKTVDYAKDVWQRRIIVLIAIVPGTESRALSQAFAPVAAGSDDTQLVITSAPLPGITPPAVVIADRWGEIAHLAEVRQVAELPDAAEVLSWVEHVRQRCPECEGEAR